MTSFVRWCAAALVLGVAFSATAQINPFQTRPERFTTEDRQRMYQSMREVLESQEVGATSSWESTSGTYGGTSELTRTYSRDGMRCGELSHGFQERGDAIGRFDVQACDVPGEGWKFAF